MKNLKILLISAAAALMLASCGGSTSGDSSSSSSGSSSSGTSDTSESSDTSSSSEESSQGSSEETLADPVLTGFDGLTGYGTEGQPYALAIASSGSATFHGWTDTKGQELDLSKISLAHSVDGVVSIALSQSIDASGYAQVDFAVSAVADGSTVLTITDSAASYSVNITVGEPSGGTWTDVEAGWAENFLGSEGAGLAILPEPTFNYTAASFDAQYSEELEMTAYGLTIEASDHTEEYMAQIAATTGYSTPVSDGEGGYTFTLSNESITMSGYATYTAGEIIVELAYPVATDPVIMQFGGLEGYGYESMPYTLAVPLKGTASFYGMTDHQSYLDITAISVSSSDGNVASVAVSQSKDDYGYFQVDFIVSGLSEGTSTLTITKGDSTLATVYVTVAEASLWDAVTKGWAEAGLADYGLKTPVEPEFDYTAASFTNTYDVSTWATTYTLTVTTVAENWETYLTALTTADSNWAFSSYDSTTSSYPLVFAQMMSGSSTYADGSIIITFTLG